MDRAKRYSSLLMAQVLPHTPEGSVDLASQPIFLYLLLVAADTPSQGARVQVWIIGTGWPQPEWQPWSDWPFSPRVEAGRTRPGGWWGNEVGTGQGVVGWVRQAHLLQDSLDGFLLILTVITVWEMIVLEGHLKRDRGESRGGGVRLRVHRSGCTRATRSWFGFQRTCSRAEQSLRPN